MVSRVTQVAAEGVVLATSGISRVSQVAIEVLVLAPQPGYPPGYW